jgi:hypothetical protein
VREKYKGKRWGVRKIKGRDGMIEKIKRVERERIKGEGER